MTKNEFIKVIIRNNPIYDNTSFLIDYILKKEYGEEGLGWFNWFLYELPEVKQYSDSIHHAYDSNGIPIILNTITDLYNFLEENYKNG